MDRGVCACSEGPDSCFLSRHEGVIRCLISNFACWDEFNVGFFSSTDMGYRFLRQFDPCLPVRPNDVASHVWVALGTLDDKAIVATARNDVLPDFRCA